MSPDDKPHPLQSLFYVCVLSEYNLPQLEAILARRPSDVIFVISDFGPARQGAENLSELLQQDLPGIRIHQPDQNATLALTGDDLLNAQQWVEEVLLVYLNRHKDNKACWLNMTGGTKAITLALTLGYPWDQLDYKPAREHQLLGYRQQAHPRFSATTPCELPAVTPQQVARIYNRNFQEKPANPLRLSPYSLPLTQALFEGLNNKAAGLMQIFNALNQIWSQQRDKKQHPQWQQPLIRLPLKEFLGIPEEEFAPDLRYWLQRLQQLDDTCFRLEGDSLVFPGNKPGNKKNCRAYREWLSGDWLEQLTGYWLQTAPKDTAIPESAIAYGIKAGDREKTDQSREADLLIHHKGKTHVIEVKADIPPGSSSKEATQQLGSQHAYGKVTRLLMVGPEFRHRLIQHNDWKGFKSRCQESKIQLCSNRAELLQAFS